MFGDDLGREDREGTAGRRRAAQQLSCSGTGRLSPQSLLLEIFLSRLLRRLFAAVITLACVAVACAADEPAVPAANATPNTEPFVVPRTVQPGDTISVHYVGTLDDGEVFDSSRARGQVLSFEVAAGRMIAGFDQAVRGMRVGEVKDVHIDAVDAYGEHTYSAVIAVPLEQLPEGVAVGDTLVTGTGQQVTVLEIDAVEAQIDTNHPLAGQALNFEIELVTFDSPPG